MTIAYFDCFSGISGDMTLGALIECGAERTVLDAAVEALGLGDEVSIDVRREMVLTAGDATAIAVTLNGAQARPLGKAGEVVTARFNLTNFKDYLQSR